MSEFTHWVECAPSRNWIKAEPSRNYGVSTMRLVFYVKGPKGAVQWMISTEWGVKAVRDHLANFNHRRTEFRQPNGWDLGYHSHTPHYEGQSVQDENCHVLGGPCYYDGSGLNADDVIEGFLAGGTDWLWPKLEEYYASVFEGAAYPDFTPIYAPHPDDAKAAIP